ncbi:MAG: KH domain-containing protein [Spartobacteria bacterium]|nr:KH domain-containing protein [Spartobacteria bacterium]
MSVQNTPVKMQQRAREKLEQILTMLGFACSVETFCDTEDEILLYIESPEAGGLIGRNGCVLDALQYLLNRMLHKEDEQALHCTIDVQRYRERRKDQLLKEAFEALDRVTRHGRPYRFAPLKASERKLVHRALEEHREVETYSEPPDEYGLKRLVVCPAGASKENREGADSPEVQNSLPRGS